MLINNFDTKIEFIYEKHPIILRESSYVMNLT